MGKNIELNRNNLFRRESLFFFSLFQPIEKDKKK